ncbi:MAG: phosphoglycolate phosphatase [Magnetococcales bacterium]|nr:phosphoglycolate phosphatase [Magnetococcales bacterium]NGZ05348.1 phosphoglycolate phosphatase [Magnetococcales bacterium]
MTNPIPCTALLFDLDGTLVDSAPDLWRAMNHVLTGRHLPPLPLERVRHLVGHGARALLARGLHGEQAEPPQNDPGFESAVAEFLEFYQHHLTDHSRPFPAVPEVLAHLASQGYAMAVVTNKPETLSKAMLAQLELDRFFPVVVGGETLTTRKPDPAPLLYALEQLGVPAHSGVMIGDSETDHQAARQAALPSILCTHGYNRGEPVASLAPDRVLDHFNQLPGFLRFTQETRMAPPCLH